MTVVIFQFVFSNIVINWNSLPTDCVNCNTVNTFKTQTSVLLEPEGNVIVDYIYGASLCLLMPSLSI